MNLKGRRSTNRGGRRSRVQGNLRQDFRVNIEEQESKSKETCTLALVILKNK